MSNKQSEDDFVTLHKKDGTPYAIHKSQFDKEEKDKQRHIQYNLSESKKKANEELEAKLNKPTEYKYEYTEHGYDIIHFHLKDRVIYQIWENDIFLDEADSTGDLLYLIKQLKKGDH